MSDPINPHSKSPHRHGEAPQAKKDSKLDTRIRESARSRSPEDEETRSLTPPLEERDLEVLTPLGKTTPEIDLSPRIADLFINTYITFLQEGGEEGIDRDFLLSRERALRGEKPRVEIRQINGRLLQLAIGTTSKGERTQFHEFLKDKLKLPGVQLVLAGSTTLELCTKGVDKSTPMRYLSHPDRFAAALEQMGYVPGKRIDATRHCTLVSCDADGTIWEKPKALEAPTFRDFSKSPANEAMLTYLRQGGVLLINSGNDPDRVAEKIRKGIPDGEKELLRNILISAAGGSSLFCIKEGGGGEGGDDYTLFEIDGFREIALREDLPQTDIDMIYIGDDVKPIGNDWAAFSKAGFAKSFCVTNATTLGKERLKESFSEGEMPSIIHGNEFATKHIFEAITTLSGGDEKLFSSDESLRQIHRLAKESRHTALLQDITHLSFMMEMIKKHNTDGYNALRNAVPSDLSDFGIARKALSDTHVRKLLLDSFESLDSRIKKHSSIRHEMKSRSRGKLLKKTSSGDLMTTMPQSHKRVIEMKRKLRGTVPFTDALLLSNALQVPRVYKGSEAKETTRKQIIEQGADVLLINGNNDLSQVDHIVHIIKAMPPEKRPKHVLVSGFGGHGTSHGPIWAHTEADVLATHFETLIGVIPGYEPKIHKEPNATNSGENVRFSVKILQENDLEHSKILISGTPPAILRQTLSFAAQCGDFPYESLSFVPPSETELAGYYMNEDKSLVHIFCALREMTSLMAYSINSPFVAPHPIEIGHLNNALLVVEDYYQRITGKHVFDSRKELLEVCEAYNRIQNGTGKEGDKELVNTSIAPLNDFFRAEFQHLEDYYMEVRDGSLHDEYLHHRISERRDVASLVADPIVEEDVHPATDADFE